MPHLSDVRSDKTAFQLATVLAYVKQTAETTVAKNLKPGMSPWEAVGESILQLVQEGSDLLPLALEAENVVKSEIFRPYRNCITNTQGYIFSHRNCAVGHPDCRN